MIIKKDGSLQEFDSSKITNAIDKSARRVCVSLSDEDKATVVNIVKNKLDEQKCDVPVTDVHNMVECALDEIAPNVAKAYREYRNYKKDFSVIIDNVYNKKLSLNSVSDRSNANADSSLITTQKSIVYNELNSMLYDKFFLNDEEREIVKDGYLYIHDKGSRLDTTNCCLLDVPTILHGGFLMGNLEYTEPKSVRVAFDVICDIILNAGSSQYGGLTVSQFDKLIAPYAEKSYQQYIKEYKKIIEDINASYDEKKADLYAYNKVKKDMEAGVQSIECRLNSLGSARGDYVFTAITFGLGTGRWETLFSSVCMKVRKEGQGRDGFKHPVLFPKLSFFYDENLHGEGKPLEWLFDEAIDCSSKSMYPDFISLTGDGYAPSIYKKYGVPISRMGCRAHLSPWFERGGKTPADENDKPRYEGRINLGAISIHFPMIAAKALEEKKSFWDLLTYYLDIARGIHKKTFKYLSHKKAGINPLGFCQGGFLNGFKKPDEEIGEELLRPMTMSFGVIALNEASILMTGKSISEDNKFSIEILKFVNDYIARYKEIDNILYAIYGVPGETLCTTQVKQFRKKYGIVKGVSDHEYTTNSFHCCVRDDITPIAKQDIEYPMFHLCTGGNIQYCRYPLQYNFEAIKTLVKRAMDMGFYEGVNISLDFCANCGCAFHDADKCPKCGSEDLVRIERMNGYLGYAKIRGKSFYADGKLKEFEERVSM